MFAFANMLPSRIEPMLMKIATVTTLLMIMAVVVVAACAPVNERTSAERPHNPEDRSIELQVRNQSSATTSKFESTDTFVSSRGVDIPVTLIRPHRGDQHLAPLLVMVHGHGGSRNEAGGFKEIAARLAALGIASIRMDFPGCGDSSESFSKNNLSNMLADIRASLEFAIGQENIDAERVGLLGYSIGGRLALLATASDDRYRLIAMWAPDGQNGEANMANFVGGREAYSALKSIATSDGYAPFTTPWGQDQQLGLQWFLDLEQSRPMDAAERFTGAMLVVYGEHDEVIPPSTSESVLSAATSSRDVVRHVVKGADHGFGLYTEEPALTEELLTTTIDFISSRL